MAHKKKAGRKKIEIDLTGVAELAAQGNDYKTIALLMGVSESTFHRRKKDSEDFANAIKKGNAKCVKVVVSELLKSILKGNIAAIIFYLKCKAGWNELADVMQEEKTQKFKVTIEPSRDLTDEQTKLLGLSVPNPQFKKTD